MGSESALRVSATLKQLAVVAAFVDKAGRDLGANPQAVADMVQAVDEAVTNIIMHGYHGAPGIIEVEAARAGNELVVRIRDWAPVFDPTTVPPPDLTIPLRQRARGGLGVHLMRRFTDRLLYSPLPDGGNELTLIKRAV